MSSEKKYWTCGYCDKTLEMKSKWSSTGHLRKCQGWRDWKDQHITEEFLEREYVREGKSLPQITEELGLRSHGAIISQMKKFGIKTRSISKSKKQPKAQQRARETCLEKYGVENPSQAEDIKEKKRQTFLDNYGVDNIWKADWYRDYSHEIMVEKYGKGSVPNLYGNANNGWDKATPEEKRDRLEKMREGSKRWYNSLTEEEKTEFYQKLGNSLIDVGPSSLEYRIKDIFEQEGIPHQHQFWVSRRSYDFRIWNSGGKLLEVQGDFWHANPDQYEDKDELNHGGTLKTASELWKKDAVKKELAEGWGYEVLYIWESEMNEMTDDELLECLRERLRLS